jgi:hypothetical protein
MNLLAPSNDWVSTNPLLATAFVKKRFVPTCSGLVDCQRAGP